MKKYVFIVIFILLTILISTGCIETTTDVIKYRSAEVTTPKMKQGEMSFTITIRTDESAETARLWLPYPVSNENQQVENITVLGNYNYIGIYREATNGNMIIYAEWFSPQEFPNLNFSFDIKRSEIFLKNFPEEEVLLPVDVEVYLQPTNLAPTDGLVKEYSDEITEEKTTILEKATESLMKTV